MRLAPWSTFCSVLAENPFNERSSPASAAATSAGTESMASSW